MWHHLDRARRVYHERGFVELVQTAVRYVPIELNNIYHRTVMGRGDRIMDEDWDTLVILDACRFDLFADTIALDGSLESRNSLGSTSEEFLRRNFAEKTFHDTVYVNTNPYLTTIGLDQGTFHAVIDLLDRYDPSLRTIEPTVVVQAAIDAIETFPDKRIIVHFMQPHVPFIGPTGERLDGGGWTRDRTEPNGRTIWQHLRDDQQAFDIDLVWQAYRENLDIVLEAIDPLVEPPHGKTVITSDHGNLLGERYRPIPSRRKYGHPYGIYLPELVRVPWFIIDSDDRPAVNPSPPLSPQPSDDETVKRRLEDLGYR